MKNITVLGSTGSIGTQTLEVLARNKDKFRLTAITGYSNIKLLEEQTRCFAPKFVAVANEKYYTDLKIALADTDTTVLCGVDGMCEVASLPENDIVVSSTVGISGLKPTLSAIEAGHDIALANKETLVTAGQYVKERVRANGVKLLPVDSEHSAIFQCLECGHKPRRLILTASGGPFFGRKKEELKNVTLQEALKHPNWSMGQKITIDSATMMNKGLEIIEAKWLFDMDVENIDVVVHRESIIHSLIELTDGSVLAQMGEPDMKLPISVALFYPEREVVNEQPFDFLKHPNLSFYQPDEEAFPCLRLAKESLGIGGTMPCFMNGANEAAVDLFLREKIGFLDIPELIEKAMQTHTVVENYTLSDIEEADNAAREAVIKQIGGLK
ncbi:MAG: 1-deoxy-D-xylulose-5-phosphate reductoisomerase [Clostridia bacterium]|nr:1-deoxy-D-xylulose-5-phosphate reductoisomerase [Clostridia bacterium]